MLNTFIHFIYLLIGFSLVIFIHEFGHFIVAKWVGIRIDQFAIGFGQAALAWRKGLGLRIGTTTPEYERRLQEGVPADSMSETEYRLNWFPLGGYVKMLGQEDLESDKIIDDPRSYTSQSIGARMAVISAGVIFNMISAFIFFLICFSYGVKFPPPIVGSVQPGSPAATVMPADAKKIGITQPGLKPGDRILKVNNREAIRFSDIQIAAAMSKADSVIDLLVDRSGQKIHFLLTPTENPQLGMMMVGIAPPLDTQIDPRLKTGEGNTLFSQELARLGIADSGLQPGMVLHKANGKVINNYWDLQDIVNQINDSFTVKAEFINPDNKQAAPVVVNLKVDPELMTSNSGLPHLFGLTPPLQISGLDMSRHGNAYAAGMQIGDVIAKIETTAWPQEIQLRSIVQAHKGEPIHFEVLRDGKMVNMTVKANRQGVIGIYMSPAYSNIRFSTLYEAVPPALNKDSQNENTPPANKSENSDSLAELKKFEDTHKPLPQWAGAEIIPPFPPGSRVVSVDGNPVNDWRQFKYELTRSTNPEESVSVVRLEVKPALPNAENEVVEWSLPRDQVKRLHDLKWSLQLGFFAPKMVLIRGSNAIGSVELGLNETWQMLAMTYLTIDRVARGTVAAKNLKGPVGIMQIGTAVSERGLMELILFLGMISVNLAVLNFLPIPILDGGQFVFLLIEKIKGSPVNPQIQDLATLAGLVILGGLFLFVTFNDISGLF